MQIVLHWFARSAISRCFTVTLENTKRVRDAEVRFVGFGCVWCSAKEKNGPLFQLAMMTEGYSGSDLSELCKTAAYRPIRDFIEFERKQKGNKGTSSQGDQSDSDPPPSVQLRKLTIQDFVEALKVQTLNPKP